MDSWSRLAVALAASLSALSLFADNEILTAAFAVTTAVVSALNAAWEPSRKATQHRRAAKEYGKCVGTLYDFITVVGSWARHYVPETAYDTGTDRYYDAGRWIGHDLSDQELQDFWSQFLTYKDEIEAIEANAPSMGRLFAENMDAGPQTRFGLWRMERYLRLQKNAAEATGLFAIRGPAPGTAARRAGSTMATRQRTLKDLHARADHSRMTDHFRAAAAFMIRNALRQGRRSCHNSLLSGVAKRDLVVEFSSELCFLLSPVDHFVERPDTVLRGW